MFLLMKLYKNKIESTSIFNLMNLVALTYCKIKLIN